MSGENFLGPPHASRMASKMPTVTSRRSASGNELATDSTRRLKRFSEKVMAVSFRTAACVRCVIMIKSRVSERISCSPPSIATEMSRPCACTCTVLSARSRRAYTCWYASKACDMDRLGGALAAACGICCPPNAPGTMPACCCACCCACWACCAAASARCRWNPSYTTSCCGCRPPTLALSASGRSRGYLAPGLVETMSTKTWLVSRHLRRAWYAAARPSSMSRIAFSVDAFSISMQPRSKLSFAHTCTICSTKLWSCVTCCRSDRKWLLMLIRNGSLHVTNARLPARLEIIKCAPLRSCCSLGSVAKSLRMTCLVVTDAIVTDRSTTGWMISRMARSTARETMRRCAGFTAKNCSDGLMVTYAARLGMTVCSCDRSTLASPSRPTAPLGPTPPPSDMAGMPMDGVADDCSIGDCDTGALLTVKSGF